MEGVLCCTASGGMDSRLLLFKNQPLLIHSNSLFTRYTGQQVCGADLGALMAIGTDRAAIRRILLLQPSLFLSTFAQQLPFPLHLRTAAPSTLTQQLSRLLPSYFIGGFHYSPGLHIGSSTTCTPEHPGPVQGFITQTVD